MARVARAYICLRTRDLGEASLDIGVLRCDDRHRRGEATMELMTIAEKVAMLYVTVLKDFGENFWFRESKKLVEFLVSRKQNACPYVCAK